MYCAQPYSFWCGHLTHRQWRFERRGCQALTNWCCVLLSSSRSRDFTLDFIRDSWLRSVYQACHVPLYGQHAYTLKLNWRRHFHCRLSGEQLGWVVLLLSLNSTTSYLRSHHFQSLSTLGTCSTDSMRCRLKFIMTNAQATQCAACPGSPTASMSSPHFETRR